eukprot:TRINITY_DN20373_c0_g1_i1.p1 TRINITY_DN20373_c0_g1~~TRINITY_DN20373_c0_g1_i1.p1  ORF type:complete len:426 (+),score=152.28 TRINITY_DN20373_c0_g1_i1:52-1329(+)
MAGSVGGAVVGCPGYAGYIPSCRQPLTTTNSSVTSRMDLVGRTKVSQAVGLHGPTVTSDHEILKDPTQVFLMNRSTEKTTYTAQSSHRPDAAQWKQPATKAAAVLQRNIRLAETLSEKASGSNSNNVTFNASSVYRGSFEKERDPKATYFSDIQKRETKELAEANQVTEDLVRPTRASAKAQLPTQKRQQRRAETCEKENQQFPSTERRTLLGVEQSVGNGQELVKFKQSYEALSSNHREFGGRGFIPTAKDHMPDSVDTLKNAATTRDLFKGTAKSTLGLRLPGYLGHVAAHPQTYDKIKYGERDLVKDAAQNIRLIATSKQTLPGYSGYEPKSLHNDREGPNKPDQGFTSSGNAALAVINSSSKEKAMNNTEHAKKIGIKKFFTQGAGQPDHSISEQFYVKFRPMEGSLKMGAPEDRIIPRTK